jgi:hypothetical protein
LLQDLKDRGDFLQRHSGSGFVQEEHFCLQGKENADFKLALSLWVRLPPHSILFSSTIPGARKRGLRTQERPESSSKIKPVFL